MEVTNQTAHGAEREPVLQQGSLQTAQGKRTHRKKKAVSSRKQENSEEPDIGTSSKELNKNQRNRSGESKETKEAEAKRVGGIPESKKGRRFETKPFE